MRQPITKFTTFVAKTMLKRSSFTFNQGVLIWPTRIIIMSVISRKEVIEKGWEIIIVIIHNYSRNMMNIIHSSK